MKQYLLILSCCLTLWSGFGCQSDLQLSEDSTLTLSVAERVEASAEGGVIEVAVVSSKPTWEVLNGANWVTITPEKGKFSIAIAPNPTAEQRIANIIVRNNQATSAFSIVQAAGKVFFTADQNDVLVNQWGEDLYFSIDGNIKEWQVVSSVTQWATYEVNYMKNELRVHISENQSSEDRAVTFYIHDKAQTNSYEIRVKQEGAMYHVLPFMGFSQDERPVLEHENKRRSTLIAKPSSGNGFQANTNTWIFATASRMFSQIFYTIEEDERGYRSATVVANDQSLFTRSTEVEKAVEFLRKQGFEQRTARLFYHHQHECSALIGVDQQAGSYIKYDFEPKQPKPFPTFEAFPWFIMERADWRTHNKATIAAYEATLGGVYIEEKQENDDEGTLTIVLYKGKEHGGMVRVYTFLDSPNSTYPPLRDVYHIFADPSKLIYEVRGIVAPTREFHNLTTEAGFRWLMKTTEGMFMYEHLSRNLYMGYYKIEEEDPDAAGKPFTFAKMDFLHRPERAGGVQVAAPESQLQQHPQLQQWVLKTARNVFGK